MADDKTLNDLDVENTYLVSHLQTDPLSDEYRLQAIKVLKKTKTAAVIEKDFLNASSIKIWCYLKMKVSVVENITDEVIKTKLT